MEMAGEIFIPLAAARPVIHNYSIFTVVAKTYAVTSFSKIFIFQTPYYFIKNFCKSASVVSSPIVINSVPVRRANIAMSSLVRAVDTTE